MDKCDGFGWQLEHCMLHMECILGVPYVTKLGGGHGKSDIYARLTCLEQIITIIFTKYMIIYVLLV